MNAFQALVRGSSLVPARRLLTAALAGVLLAGCTSGGSSDDTAAARDTPAPTSVPGTADATAAAPVPAPAGRADGVPDLRGFYGQKPAWRTCPAQQTGGRQAVLQCATLRVPLDYAAPDGKTVDLAVYRVPARGPRTQRLGTLAVNPGGPGTSVRGTVAALGQSANLGARYDIVGFDPRGVGGSAKADCADGPLMDRVQAIDPTPDDTAALDEAAAVLAEFGRGCAERMGDLLPHVGTTTAADDMDVFRDALGADKLNYLGMSYGTYLGGIYAERHPDRVGRFVLDGLVDPALDRIANAREQALGFEQAFRAFAADCVTRGGCPFAGTPDDAVRSLRARLDAISAAPIALGTRTLGEAMVSTVVSMRLYNPAQWPALRQLLGSLYAGNPRPMLSAFDETADRALDGTYDSNLPAYHEINCADGRALSAAEAAALAREVAASAPALGPSTVWSWAADCAAPGPDRARPLDGAGLPGMLLVSTTRDPATPHAAAARVRRQLPGSVVVTYNGDGHVAYSQGNGCAVRAVEAFLLTGRLPARDTTCS
ncbi:alpha/beta hydrolase [Yinghuangia sp. ASG 101]|uniref:alpha/beta hydrolase n=1 Tax=Yinghuangia sp. ASG 101 TaxID=2896848 RepID=UPI001E323CC8|nr:alpha/beta hydrolase [Yinghuangia sp. ASG 101]UGQ12601.1 alpha/beta hydrolase [Yinghuangia sp. ASG 101]